MKLPVYAAVLLAMSIGMAHAVDPPPLHEGLWQMRVQDVTSPGNQKTDETSQVCRNHALDQRGQAIIKNMKGCTRITENLEGSTYTLEMRCLVGKTVIDGKSVVTFQGDTAVHSESHTTFTPAMGGEAGGVEIQDAKYLGSCPACMKVGDRISQNGSVMHAGRP
jgi:hypothetical protein